MSDIIKHGSNPPFRPGQKTGLAARKEALKQQQLATTGELPADQVENRIGIIFDESGSMGATQMRNAKDGVEEFLRSCGKDITSVAVYTLSANAPNIALTKQLPAVAIMVKNIQHGGSTPLVQRLQQMLAENRLTRAIVFSDGRPDSYNEDMYGSCLAAKVPVDTVYIPSAYVDSSAVDFMKKLAQDTGGIYLQFEQGKSNFAASFKYLSPGMRYMLMDTNFVKKLEGR